MKNLTINDDAPDFNMITTSNSIINLCHYEGKNLVLYFYPKDNTPGCTIEAQKFNEAISEFNKLNTIILGVSKDNIASHQKFKDKLCLKFELGYDETGKILEDYGVLKEKSMFKNTFLAISRTTFLINQKGKIAAIWPKVNIAQHSDEVLNMVKNTI
ncbi:peroxiredoxin [Orientia tsutsugamushi]|uniref:peroxiredoxin n=1 Tax=Orientia tsutsugamushi TaxID=784 RepID=UPI0035283745